MATTKDLDFYGMFDFNTGDGDIYKYTADEFALLIKGLCGDGISYGAGNQFATTASGVTLTVKSGACFIDGHYGYLNSNATLTLTATASGATRKDRVVLRMDKSSRKIILAVKTGTATAFPALTNNDTVKEIAVYGATVTNGSTVSLTDERVFTYSAAAIQTALNSLTTSISGKADTSHTHTGASLTSAVPVNKGGTGSTTAAGAITNLGITPAAIGAAASSHTHNYAGSSSAGGAATSATQLATSRNITIGNKTNAFNGSANISYTLAAIGAAATEHTHSPSDLNAVVPVSKGGTGAITAAAALNNLGIIYAADTPTVINGAIWLKPLT